MNSRKAGASFMKNIFLLPVGTAHAVSGYLGIMSGLVRQPLGKSSILIFASVQDGF
jgi:hypothetical protein